MEISHVEDEFSERTLSEAESIGPQRTVHDDSSSSASDASSSSYFLYGKTKTKSKKLLELGQKINNVVSTVEAPPQEGQVRSCPYCGQEFRSGKALGGHIRIHKKPTKSTDNKYSMVTDQKDVHVCFICKESFPSIMSLCGHMRNHPERDWKGIRPPNGTTEPQPEPKPDPNPEPEPDVQLEQYEPGPVLNLLDFISNWSMTGKRGREATISANKLRIINQLPEKKRKIQDAEAWNQAYKLPRIELTTTETAAATVEVEEGEILEKDLPEEGEIIEAELDNVRKVDRSSDPMMGDHLGELAWSDAPSIIDNNKKREFEAHNPDSEREKIALQHYGKKITSLTRRALNLKSFLPMAEEEIDFKVGAAGKNGRFDHKASLSLEANQNGTMKIFNFDLNLPYEE